MGPHPASAQGAAHGLAGTSRSDARRASSGVLPLRVPQPTVYRPGAGSAVVPIGRPHSPVRPRSVVPVSRRPWRVLVVSAAPGTAPRSFEVPRWQARAVLVAVVLVTTLACSFVAAVVVAVRTPDLFVGGAELGRLRAELAATQDSLAEAQADASLSALGESGDLSDSLSSNAEAAVLPTVVPAVKPATPDRPKPLRARAVHRRPGGPEVASGIMSGMPRSLSELPVIGAIVSGFSLARRHPLLHITRPHLGVDVAAPRGTRVSAPAAGRVRYVGRKVGYGLVVELDHGDGITTRYAHLRSAAVQAGEDVTKGEAIAAVGTSGITTGPHLHYEVLVNGRQVDPLRFRFAGAAAAAGAPIAPVAPVAATNGPVGAGPATAPGVNAATHEGAVPNSLAPMPR
jgi:murein DD-endopeptidase MepM/ murein hydrolase activator NlpD